MTTLRCRIGVSFRLPSDQPSRGMFDARLALRLQRAWGSLCRIVLPTLLILMGLQGARADDAWVRHTIDDTSRGADGVRLGDVDRDGRLDIATGWEEGGRIRICFHPGADHVGEFWPSIEVGRVRSPEDAVPIDFNRDGWLDVVSSCEGREQNVYVHLNPGSSQTVRNGMLWKTVPLDGAAGMTRWMFCSALPDNTLVLGSKAPQAQITLWTEQGGFQKLRDCGWIMSLCIYDVDGDGEHDIVYSDRKGSHRGIGWLRNPGPSGDAWTDHNIGGQNSEVMFLVTLPSHELERGASGVSVVCNTRNGFISVLNSSSANRAVWSETRVAHPAGVGGGKGIAVADINCDGSPDLVATCEGANGVVGVFWLQSERDSSGKVQYSKFHDVSGVDEGIKFDRIEIVDLDQDGDPDVLTCEERDNLGVIWYENPQKSE